ncbi:MAG TPA: hypothetical protein VF493_13065 [Terriglobales bacterium]
MKTSLLMLSSVWLLAVATGALFLLSMACKAWSVSAGENKRVVRWLTALCAIPWLLIIVGYIEACVVRLVLSKWPRPCTDDPKQLSTAPVHLSFQILFLFLYGAIPLLIAFALWNWREVLSDSRYSRRLGAFVVGLFAIWVLVQYDPGHIWDWLLD